MNKVILIVLSVLLLNAAVISATPEIKKVEIIDANVLATESGNLLVGEKTILAFQSGTTFYFKNQTQTALSQFRIFLPIYPGQGTWYKFIALNDGVQWHGGTPTIGRHYVSTIWRIRTTNHNMVSRTSDMSTASVNFDALDSPVPYHEIKFTNHNIKKGDWIEFTFVDGIWNLVAHTNAGMEHNIGGDIITIEEISPEIAE